MHCLQAQYKNPWSELSEQDIAALPAGRQLRERPSSAALCAKPPPAPLQQSQQQQQRQRSPSKSKSPAKSCPAKPDTSQEVLRVRDYVPIKKSRKSLGQRGSSDLCLDITPSTVRPALSRKPSMEPSPVSPHRDDADPQEPPTKRLKPDAQQNSSPAPSKLSFKFSKPAVAPSGNPEASSSTASLAQPPPPPPTTEGQEPISDFKRNEMESRKRTQAQAQQQQQINKKPSVPQVRPAQSAASSSSTPKAQPPPQSTGPKTSSALLQHLGGRHKPSPAPASASASVQGGSRPGTPTASSKIAADNGVKPSASHLPSAKALGKQQHQQQQSTGASSDQQQAPLQAGSSAQPPEAIGVAPSTPADGGAEKPKRKEVNGLAKLMKPNALSVGLSISSHFLVKLITVVCPREKN